MRLPAISEAAHERVPDQQPTCCTMYHVPKLNVNVPKLGGLVPKLNVNVPKNHVPENEGCVPKLNVNVPKP